MMKRTIVLLLLTFLCVCLPACGNRSEDVQAKFLELIGEPAAAEHLSEVVEYMDETVPSLDIKTASSIVAAYEDYLYEYTKNGTEQMEIENLKYYCDTGSGTVDRTKIKGTESELLYNNLLGACAAVSFSEGAVTVNVDYGELLAHYGEYLQDGLKAFYEFAEEINEEPLTEGAVLQVSWNQILDRAKTAEQLLAEYGKDPLIRKDVLPIYQTYLRVLLMGTTNTPVFDYTTKAFSQEAKAAEDVFVSQNRQLVITWVLAEYHEKLKELDYSLDLNDSEAGKAFFDDCEYLVKEAAKKVLEQNESDD
mgnify:FL=1